MNINWYPGHMAKTKREITEDLRLIDVVIEILDARIPISSQNPDIKELTKNKKKVILLNKYDLAEESETKKWQMYFKSQGIETVLINANDGRGISQVINKIEEVMKEEIKIQAQKGRIRKDHKMSCSSVFQMFGKSSFINRVSKKNTLRVGNKPGVTIRKQWIRLSKNIELLDTPGVLWPKFDSEEIGLNLSYTGTIKDEVLDTEEIAFYLTKYLINNHLEKLITKYKLDENKIKNLIETEDENNVIIGVIQMVGKSRGAYISRTEK